MMGPMQAVQTCLRKYVIMSGRAPRSEFWWFYLFVLLTFILVAGIDAALFGIDSEPRLIDFLITVAFILPLFSASVRRLHDSGRSLLQYFLWGLGSFALGIAVGAVSGPVLGENTGLVAGAVMVLGYLYIFYWFIAPSDVGENAYGPNPLEEAIK